MKEMDRIIELIEKDQWLKKRIYLSYSNKTWLIYYFLISLIKKKDRTLEIIAVKQDVIIKKLIRQRISSNIAGEPIIDENLWV